MNSYTGLVSCIMPVRSGHEQFIGRALDCFESQTYHFRELIVILDDSKPANSLGLGMLGIPGAQVSHRPAGEQIDLRRNVACALASGEIVCHWDVDDWSAPERIQWQIEAMALHPKCQVLGLRSMYFYDERDRQTWLYEDRGPVVNLGTSLMYRRSWWRDHPFSLPPGRRAGEDWQFVLEAHRARVLRLEVESSLMVARSHDYNTCERRGHPGSAFTRVRNADLPIGFREVIGDA